METGKNEKSLLWNKRKKNENKFKNASLTQKLTGYLPQQKEKPKS